MNENLVEHDGIKYEFVEGGSCLKCDIFQQRHIPCNIIKCTPNQRIDRKDGNFKNVENV